MRPFRKPLLGTVILAFQCIGTLFAGETEFSDTNSGAETRVGMVALNEVEWTRGFWAQRFELCRQQMIPSMWRLMEGTHYSHYFQNFRIAAGLAEGRHRGAQFNDGDFYKWFEGACAVLAVTQDAELRRQIGDIVRVIKKAQRADGYLQTAVLIRSRNGDPQARPFESPLNFETYSMGHLMTAACVHYRATGEPTLLDVARRVADFLESAFQQPTPELARCSICPSHYMGLVDLYRTTNEPRYLELAKRLFALRGLVTDGGDDNQDRIPFSEQTTAIGHAVRANYLYAGAADLFLETGDTDFLKPLQQIWTNVVEQKMYITGGCGALYDGASPDGARSQRTITRVHQAYGRNYQLPNLTAHNETCANIGNVLWNWRMFRATGSARFMDVVELALYNSVLCGTSLNGTNFFYVNPLRQVDPLPSELRWSRTRVPYVSSFCCPPNLVRTIAEVGGYAYSKSDAAVWVNLYGSSKLATTLPDGSRVKLSQETEYPWNGQIGVKVEESPDTVLSIRLRIPGWAGEATVWINDKMTGTSPSPGTYFEIRRTWQPGDRIDLEIPMPPRLIEANPLVEETLNQIAVKRGPLVYCLESTDLPPDVRVLNIRVPSDLNLVARFDSQLLGGVSVLNGTVMARTSEDWSGRLYREHRSGEARPVQTKFVPYFVWGNRGKSEMSVWLPVGRP